MYGSPQSLSQWAGISIAMLEVLRMAEWPCIRNRACNGTFTLIECDDDDSANGLMPYIIRAGLVPGSTVYALSGSMAETTTAHSGLLSRVFATSTSSILWNNRCMIREEQRVTMRTMPISSLPRLPRRSGDHDIHSVQCRGRLGLRVHPQRSFSCLADHWHYRHSLLGQLLLRI